MLTISLQFFDHAKLQTCEPVPVSMQLMPFPVSSFLDLFSETLPQPRRQRVAQEAEEHAEGVVLYRAQGQPRIDSIFNRLE